MGQTTPSYPSSAQAHIKRSYLHWRIFSLRIRQRSLSPSPCAESCHVCCCRYSRSASVGSACTLWEREGRRMSDDEERVVRVVREEVGYALGELFMIDILDTLLPHLNTPNTQLRTHILNLFASCTRSTTQRAVLTAWTPPSERAKEVRARRGWEVAPLGPGWVVRELISIVRHGGGGGGGKGGRGVNEGVLEAALSLLAALCRDSPGVVGALVKPDREGYVPLDSVLGYAKGRKVGVQIGACLCLTHAIRASLTTPPTTAPIQTLEDICVRTVINVVGGLIKDDRVDVGLRMRGCYVLNYLATDHPMICRAVMEQGCVESLALLVKSITPDEVVEGGEAGEEGMSIWEDESLGVVELREASLTTLATLSLFDNKPRAFLTSTTPSPSPSPPSSTPDKPPHPPSLPSNTINILPLLSVSLTHPHAGVRTAACQCVRALSRAVEPLRTSVIDSGLGIRVWEVVLDEWERGACGGSGSRGGEGGKGRGGGDRRVVNAGLTVVCNIVNEFSPLRDTMIEQGFVPRLMQIFHRASESAIRVSCLWAIKNLVRMLDVEKRREVMGCIGWGVVSSLLTDSDTAIQEQAFNILHNLASDDDGVDLVFEEVGTDVVLDRITAVLGGSDDDVILQATSLLANLANGTEQRKHSILTHPRLLSALRSSIAESKPEARKRAVACVVELAEKSNREDKRRMLDAGLGGTLRHLCEWSVAGVAAPSSPTATSPLRSAAGRRNSSIARSVSGGAPGMVRSISGGNAGVGVGGIGAVHQWRIGSVSGHGHGVHGVGVHGHHSVMEDDRDVVGPARRALEWLEHGDSYSF
ncbi:armadillo-type protein [Cyathus striatus]|nr:armadillo-type protein [Cyathus striatus]